MFVHALSITGLFFYFFALIYLFRTKKVVFYAFSLFFFPTTWRVISSFYVDYFGPFDSWELHKSIGGDGGLFFFTNIYIYFFIVGCILFSFQKKDLILLNENVKYSKNSSQTVIGFRIENVLLISISLIIFLVYFELFSKGEIPLISGMPRWVYGREIAGPFYKIFNILLGPMFWTMGFIYFNYTISSQVLKKRLTLLILFFSVVYIYLIGNKFTTPIYNILIFMIGSCGIFLVKRKTRLIDDLKKGIILLSFIAFTIGAMYKVFLIDRGYKPDYLIEFLEQRILVFPSQLVWGAYERVLIKGNWDILNSIYLTIVNPIVTQSNPSVHFLMYKELGDSVINFETSFTDAYPGIMFELGGPYLSFLFIAALAISFVFSTKRLIINTLNKDYYKSLLYFFIVQALIMFHIQGQLIFLTSPKFYIKIMIALLLIQTTEASRNINQTFGKIKTT